MNDADRAELPEVFIESKSGGDAELFDDGFACAIGKTPIFVGIVAENLPRAAQIVCCQLMNVCNVV